MNSFIENLYNSNDYNINTGGWCPDEDKEKAVTVGKILEKAGVASKILSILDIGCGAGRVLAATKNSLNQDVFCEGIDFSELAIKKAREIETSGLVFSSKSLCELDRKYDLLILSHVLEHVMDWDVFLEDVKKISDGYIYINVPLEVNLLNTLRGTALTGTYRNYGHVHFFDEDFVTNYLIDSGFEVIAKEYGEEFKVSSSTLRGKFARLPRRILGMISKRLTVKLLGGYSLAVLLKVQDTV